MSNLGGVFIIRKFIGNYIVELSFLRALLFTICAVIYVYDPEMESKLLFYLMGLCILSIPAFEIVKYLNKKDKTNTPI